MKKLCSSLIFYFLKREKYGSNKFIVATWNIVRSLNLWNQIGTCNWSCKYVQKILGNGFNRLWWRSFDFD